QIACLAFRDRVKPLKWALNMDKMKASIVEDLPEIEWISDAQMRDAAIEAWALALSRSSFERVRDIPGEANPGIMVMRRGGQDVHLRGVTKLALASVDYFADAF